MTFASWPVTNQLITHDLWSKEFSGQDGIIDDYNGNGFRLVLPGTGDNATIKSGSGRYRLRGFILSVTADHTVNLPGIAVGGADKTYDIGIKYDSTLEADALGPLSIFTAVAGSYSGTSTTSYHVLYQVIRSASQVLSAATVSERRLWVGGSYTGFGTTIDLPLDLPMGSRCTVGKIDYYRARIANGDGTYHLEWRPVNQPTWTALTLASGLRRTTTTPAYTVVGSETILRGQLERTSGAQLAAASASLTVATLPSGARPLYSHTFSVSVSFAGTNDSGRIVVGSDGRITFIPSGSACYWASLDGVRFFTSEY